MIFILVISIFGFIIIEFKHSMNIYFLHFRVWDAWAEVFEWLRSHDNARDSVFGRKVSALGLSHVEVHLQVLVWHVRQAVRKPVSLLMVHLEKAVLGRRISVFGSNSVFETVVHVHIHDSLVHLAEQRVFDFDGDGFASLDRDHEDFAFSSSTDSYRIQVSRELQGFCRLRSFWTKTVWSRGWWGLLCIMR